MSQSGPMPDAAHHWADSPAQFRALAADLLAVRDDLLTDPTPEARSRAIASAADVEAYPPAVLEAYRASLAEAMQSGDPDTISTVDKRTAMFRFISGCITGAAALVAALALSFDEEARTGQDPRVTGFLLKAAQEYDSDEAFAMASACRDVASSYDERRLRGDLALIHDLDYLRWLVLRAAMRLEDRATAYIRACTGATYERLTQPD